MVVALLLAAGVEVAGFGFGELVAVAAAALGQEQLEVWSEHGKQVRCFVPAVPLAR